MFLFGQSQDGGALRCHAESDKFHDDDGSVDDDAEVDGSQTHQVGVDAEDVHQRDAKEKAERDHRGHHESRADVADQQNHNEGDNQEAQDQVFRHCFGSFGDKGAPFQEGIDINPFGEGFLDFRHPGFYVVDDLFGVGILEHHHLPQHLFALSVTGDGPEAGGMAEAYPGHIFHQNGNAVTGGHHHILHIPEGGGQSLTPDEITLVVALDISATRHLAVLFQGAEKLPYGDFRSLQPVRIHGHFILFEIAAPGVDFHHSRNSR